MPDAYLSPTALADLVDVHPDTLRNWRVHGLVDGYGRQAANGYWWYSIRDAVAVWAGWKLIFEAKLRERARALNIAHAIAPDVVAAIRGAGPWRRFHASIYTDATAEGGTRGWEVWQGDDIRDLPVGALLVDNIINVEAFAAMVPVEIRDAILGAAEEG